MLHNPKSSAVWPRPAPWAKPALHPSPTAPGSQSAGPLRALRPVDERLLTLLGAHEVLTSGQLVRLTGMPERTVQHRLGLLHRAGFLNRLRPERQVGTSPYHCWLTPFGAAAIGAEAADHWSDDPTGVQTTAALTELWLAVRERGEVAGLRLVRWRRLPGGLPFHDLRTGSPRALPAEAELVVALPLAGVEVTILVVSRVERIPAARLAVVLARFAGYLAGSTHWGRSPIMAILACAPRVVDGVLAAVEQLGSAHAARHLAAASLVATERAVVVGTVDPRPIGLATEEVWRTAADRRSRRLVEILIEVAEATK